MADLTSFKAGIDRARSESFIDHIDPRVGFLNELTGLGYKIPQGIIEGKVQRFDMPDDDRGDKTGWYSFNTFPDFKDPSKYIGIGVYGSWRDGTKVTWSSRNPHVMSFQDRAAYNNIIEQARIAREAEQENIYAEAAITANERWNLSVPAQDTFAYLVRKQVKCYGLREYNGNLIIPVMSGGKIQSLQEIKSDGFKKNWTGGKMKGGYFKLPGREETIFVAEGYATAASIADATGCAVYMAYTAGNLYETCAYVQGAYKSSRIVICADDDINSAGNIGRTKAVHAAESLGVEVLFPDGGGDFNDMHVTKGLSAIKEILSKRPVQTYETKKTDAESLLPSGFLLDAYNYYNAVSGNYQPGFAMQTALGIASVILGRCYKTNVENYSSLYLLNVGLSATGKETAKTVVEKVLEACGHGNIIAGDGYTSEGAVLSALLDRPKHITVIDEFGRYLEASNSVTNHHQKEANTKIMESIGRCGSIMRPKQYSTMTLKKEAADVMKDRKIYNPALTILAMTTPDRFFQNLGMAAIKDGFINRFIIHISDSPRKITKRNPPLDVPQSIINWAKSIDMRNPTIHNSSEEPNFVTLTFTSDAMESQYKFQQYCIDCANALDKFGISELSGRSNEMAMKVSLIHALSRNPNSMTVEKEDIDWAINYIKISLEKTMSVLKMNISGSDHESDKKEILQALRSSSPEYVRFSSMLKQSPYSKHKKKDLEIILNALVESGLADERQSIGNGRPTKEFVAIQ